MDQIKQWETFPMGKRIKMSNMGQKSGFQEINRKDKYYILQTKMNRDILIVYSYTLF